MSLNILSIIVILILVCSVADGYKRGMVRSVISLISLIITCVIVGLIGSALSNYRDGKIYNVIIMVVLLCLIGIVKHLLGVVFVSAKLIAKLPVVSWADKVLGAVFGVMETVLFLWTVYVFVMMLDLGAVGQLILDNTQKSQILSWLYQNNYLAYLMERIGTGIVF